MSSNPLVFFKAVKPASINLPVVQRVLTAEANSIADDMILDLLVTTATWSHEVKFEKIVEVGGKGITILIGTDDRIWKWVDEGTPRHYVGPKKHPVLFFQNTYTAKTIPGLLTSRPGGRSGAWVTSKGHEVSGIEPRKFSPTLAKNWQKKLPARVTAALNQAIAEAWVSNIGRKK